MFFTAWHMIKQCNKNSQKVVKNNRLYGDQKNEAVFLTAPLAHIFTDNYFFWEGWVVVIGENTVVVVCC
ncbi:MAG: hypothetical protein UU47_C0030G0009 [candidate division TM6 bacterium GW2011_GWE2_41_16]|nr:MAG: hypothetical protein UU47_C0030G0009 [candidate division TM6 bacterium GW2011_GWE2_41_16]